MKFYIVLLFLATSSILLAQGGDPLQTKRSEVSTDISGVFFNRLRADYNFRFGEKAAFSAGLRTRGQFANIVVNDIPGAPFAGRNKGIDDALRFLDARVGMRWYLGTLPDRGFWIEPSALVSVADWQSREYREEREDSVYPDEFRDPKTTFGAEAAVGYRYVFKTGLSLSAHVSGTWLMLRDSFVSERVEPSLRESEVLDFMLGGSLLTVGYVW